MSDIKRRLAPVAIAFLALGGALTGQQTTAPIRVLKISAGPTGREANGTFVLTDERSIFNRTNDHEVLVLFEWEGSTGPHKLVAQWRSPSGGATSNSTIDYVARAPRFGAYWSLTLSPTMTLGTWTIEATVDGLPGGRYSFEITDKETPSAVTKRLLTSAELFDRLTRASVVLRRADAAGRDLPAASGYLAGGGMIYTAMAVLDDAEGLRLMTPDGTAKPLTSVTAWHRRQDWAVLVGGAAAEPLPVADAGAAKIGDRCFSIERSVTGSSVIAECAISGREAQGGALLATFSAGGGTMGAPILNEFGEIIGLAGGPGMPGATRLMDQMLIRAETKGTRVVPIGLVRTATDAAPVMLADLRGRGETASGLPAEDHAMSGGFARAFAKGAPAPTDQRPEFSSQEKTFTVFVNWSPKARLRGLMKLQLFDADNHLAGESKPTKVDLRKDEASRSTWDLPMLKTPGLYRADVMLDAAPIWRGFVRITP